MWWRRRPDLLPFDLVHPLSLLLGTNFPFLRGKPPTPSPIDDFGPWPWYLPTLEALAAELFFVLEGGATLGVRPMAPR